MRVFALFFFLLLHIVAQSASASKLTDLAGHCISYYKKLAYKTAEKHSGYVSITDQNGKEISMEVGDELGAGVIGSVYRLRSVKNLPALEGRDRMIVKFPYRLKRLGVVNPYSKIKTNEELLMFDGLTGQLPTIENDSFFPKDPAWGKGNIPAPQIVARVSSNRGKIIFKPEVSGWGMREIAESINPKTRDDIPPEMLASLKDIYDFTQAAYNKGKMPAASKPTEMSLDINPTNLIWISEPGELKRLGLSRPSMFLFEVGTMPMRYFHRDNMSFEQYLDTFIASVQDSRR